MDKAVKQLNKKVQGGGVDGFTTYFVTTFWKELKVPLFKYYNDCILKGNLTPILRVARCKLIDKKGDPTKFKNWRNISILFIFYKIYSKILANRMLPLIDKITGREQKAYKSKHICQELVANLIENLHEIKRSHQPSCAISIAFRSAFDFVSHKYINDVLEYFNFGHVFRKLIDIDLRDRQGTVYNDDNKVVGSYPVKVGTIQGGLTSPLLFIIALAPLLLRIQHDKKVKRTFKSYVNENDNFLRKESAFLYSDLETISENIDTECDDFLGSICHIESYADDITILTLLELWNIKYILKIVNYFQRISGLEVNMEKLMLQHLILTIITLS